MKIAVFHSHPIQYFAPLWKELGRTPGVDLRVFYYSRQGVEAGLDPGFGVPVAWDVDLLEGYPHEFLPRQWPTRDPVDPSALALNRGISERLAQGWDVAYVAGYAHLNNWHVARACRRLGIPLLCQLDSNILGETGKSAARIAVKRLALRTFFRMVSRAIPMSDHGRHYLLRYGMPDDRIAICPLPVDVDRFRQAGRGMTAEERTRLRARYGLPVDRPIVAFCGKLVPRKRPLDLVRALRGSEAHALFIGDGELRDAVLDEGRGRCTVTGFVNQADIPRVMSLARALVLPSEYEPFGAVVVEAMALGIPCIVSDRCGCHGPDAIVQDGITGLVYSCGDVASLSDRLRRLLAHDAPYDRFSRAARDASDKASAAAVAARLLDIADGAIREKAAPSAGRAPRNRRLS